MKLIILLGPHAVGKMTVGQALSCITGLKLFHNHMTIELLAPLFPNDFSEWQRLSNLFREEIFRAFAKKGEEGLIFTYMWAFDCPEDWDYIQHVEEIFAAEGAEIYYVELSADFDLRIERNKSENRLLHKPSKRDVQWSERLFREIEGKHRLNSFEGELQKEHYLKIDNSHLPPEDAARLIKKTFGL